jgi:hypothetical protein
MKIVSKWDAMREFGIDALTGEACSLGLRLLCDLTAAGRATVERCFGVTIRSENWNSGSTDAPHVASIMVTREMLLPLAIFALLDAGCTEVWITDAAAIGVETSDPADQVERLKEVHNLQRRFAYSGRFQDRNQHQMSGRVR